ncbi:unnamed protein product [Prunus armeniaca]|uniref:Uncharacterized protein n=1 Tax=Prunus armeniaca TaxID=36596 RepID=A0A6J5WEE8_PRUAR|nr:unnamed protein product [Prunus armeniaca]
MVDVKPRPGNTPLPNSELTSGGVNKMKPASLQAPPCRTVPAPISSSQDSTLKSQPKNKTHPCRTARAVWKENGGLKMDAPRFAQKSP